MREAGKRGLVLAIFGLLGACSQGVGTDGPGNEGPDDATGDGSTGSGPMSGSVGESSAGDDDALDAETGSESSTDSDTSASTCGNGQVEGDETCDDGNDIQSDGCNVDCLPSGSIAWSHTLAVGLGEVEAFRGLALVDGGAMVVGAAPSVDQGRDVVVRRYGSAGSLEFTTAFDGGAAADDEGYAIATHGETVYVAGLVQSDTTDGLLAKLDLEGNVVWQIAIDGGIVQADELRSVKVGPDGQPVVGGYRGVIEAMTETETTYGLDGWVAKYDASGTEVWSVAHGGDAGTNDVVEAVAVDSSGNVIAAGWESSTVGGVNVWVGKFDPAGSPLWTQTYDGAESLADYGHGVAAAADGTIVVVASEGSSTIEEMWWVRRYDTDGNPLWTDVDPGSTGEGMRARAVAISNQGTISVTGEERVAGARSIAIRKYGSDGTRLWTTKVASASDPYGLAIATDADDALYVAGALDKGVDGLDAYVARLTP